MGQRRDQRDSRAAIAVHDLRRGSGTKRRSHGMFRRPCKMATFELLPPTNPPRKELIERSIEDLSIQPGDRVRVDYYNRRGTVDSIGKVFVDLACVLLDSNWYIEVPIEWLTHLPPKKKRRKS